MNNTTSPRPPLLFCFVFPPFVVVLNPSPRRPYRRKVQRAHKPSCRFRVGPRRRRLRGPTSPPPAGVNGTDTGAGADGPAGGVEPTEPRRVETKTGRSHVLPLL